MAWDIPLYLCEDSEKARQSYQSNSNFTIIDQDDQQRLIKNICKNNNIDIKKISPNFVLALINKWKNSGWYPKDVKISRGQIFRKKHVRSL